MKAPIPSLRAVRVEALDFSVQAVGSEALRRTGDSFRTNCFLHGGTKPGTLSFRPTPDGRNWSVTCFAGCQPSAIVAVLLEAGPLPTTDGPVADFTPEPRSSTRRWFPPALLREVTSQHAALLAHPGVLDRLAAERRVSAEVARAHMLGWDTSRGRLPIPYFSPFPEDAHGVFARDHWLPSWNRQSEADETHKLLAEKGYARGLYWAAPNLLDGAAWLVEGAMDALAVASHGEPAIGAPSGTSWRAEWTADLLRARVSKLWLPAENDTTGRAFIGRVREAVESHNVEVIAVELAHTKKAADVTDFLTRFDTFQAGAAELRRLRRLAEAAAVRDGGVAVSFADVQPEHVDYLLPAIPRAMLADVAGHPGLGKSMLKAHWAAQVTRGAAGRPAADVLLLDAEDSPGTTRLRLEAAGADLPRVHLMRLRREGEEVGITIPNDLGEIERLVIECGAALVVIDPINGFFPSGIDYFKDTDVRRVLGPLSRMAERVGCAVVIVAHLNKSQGGTALHRIGGSVGYGAAVRSALFLDRDPDDEEGEQGTRRILVHAKSNVGPLIPSKVLNIVPVSMGGFDTAKIEVEGESSIGAGELLARNAERPAKTGKADACAEAIRALLADGRRDGREVRALLETAGHSKRTIQRAASQIVGVAYEEEGFPAVTYWRLPNLAATFTRKPATVAPKPDGATDRADPWRDWQSPVTAGDSSTAPPQSRQRPERGATAPNRINPARRNGVSNVS